MLYIGKKKPGTTYKQYRKKFNSLPLPLTDNDGRYISICSSASNKGHYAVYIELQGARAELNVFGCKQNATDYLLARLTSAITYILKGGIYEN